MLKKRFVVLALVAVLVATGISIPGQTANAGGSTVEFRQFSTSVCILAVRFYSNLPGQHTVEVWDDGVLVGVKTVDVTTAGEYEVEFNLGLPGDAAPGIGVDLYDPYSLRDEVDPYVPDLAAFCGAGEDMIPIPATAVGGAMVADTPVYWAHDADSLTDPLVTFEAGTTVWVVGQDATGGYYQVIFAGKYLWVPTDALGPNFDAVWNGAPLPTNVVK